MKTIFITGANRGIGLEFVRQYLSHEQIHVFATARQPSQAAALHKLKESCPGTLTVIELDVANSDQLGQATDLVAAQTDYLDILINNAGIMPTSNEDSLESINTEKLLEVLHINAVAPLMIVKAFLNLLKQANNPRVINITSQMGSLHRGPARGHYSYRSSKAALNMITRSLAADLQPHGIKSVVLHPGWVQTDMGGSSAALTPQQAVALMIPVIDNLSTEDSGGFFKWNGEPHPW